MESEVFLVIVKKIRLFLFQNLILSMLKLINSNNPPFFYGIIFSNKSFRSFRMKYNEKQQKEIAKYAIDHQKDYKATGEKYDISYQQVAAWVRKYQKNSTVSTQKSVKSTKTTKKNVQKQANALDVLSRKDPVLEAQLLDVKKRLGLF